MQVERRENMADFDNFEGANPTEEDPAAEFLAREQSELAGLEDDNFGGDSSAQQQDGTEAFGGQATEPAAQDDDEAVDTGSYDEFSTDLFGGGPMSEGGLLDTGSSGGLLDMDASQPGPTIEAAGLGDGLDAFGGGDPSGAGLLDTESSAPSGGMFADEPAPTTNGPSDAYSAISQVDSQRAEPEKIRVWREEQKARLEKKDAEEETKKAEWHEVAKKELDDWYKHHADQLEKTKENNRAAEQAFIKERDESVPGAQWEKICRLCEFNPKNMKSTKDVTRMRSMLLQLKQTPLVR